MRKLKQFSDEFDVLFLRESNPCTGESTGPHNQWITLSEGFWKKSFIESYKLQCGNRAWLARRLGVSLQG